MEKNEQGLDDLGWFWVFGFSKIIGDFAAEIKLFHSVGMHDAIQAIEHIVGRTDLAVRARAITRFVKQMGEADPGKKSVRWDYNAEAWTPRLFKIVDAESESVMSCADIVWLGVAPDNIVEAAKAAWIEQMITPANAILQKAAEAAARRQSGLALIK